MKRTASPLRSAFLAIEDRVTQAAVIFGCLGLLLATAAGFYQVLARFILFQSAAWSEPFIQTTLIWMAYVALAGAMRVLSPFHHCLKRSVSGNVIRRLQVSCGAKHPLKQGSLRLPMREQTLKHRQVYLGVCLFDLP